ncbi:MAG: F-type H+-transporting ATPase subunit delta [Frankiaceae bacterium]|jgi:F-type H+-transporting ATPase subunit delta|nr:F-type H+-transporting ATPase subunit delta [Frankiaceae bacterium]
MSDDKIDGYARAMFDVAEAEGVLGRVNDEVFRFSRIVEANPDLRSALTDPASPGEAKARVIEELLNGRVHPVTERLLVLLVDAGLARDLSRVVDAFTARVAVATGSAIAEVRVATPIDEDLRVRLAEALSQSKGRPVDVKVIVDPSVIGGVVTTIGDEVIDGSVRRRLEQLRASLAG